MICAPPHFPTWRVFDGYSAKRYRRESDGPVRLLRVPLYIPTKTGGLRRTIHYASFALASLLPALHRTFGGQANLAVLTSDGSAIHYAGNTDNPIFSFRLGQIGVLSTGIYSLDRSVFRYVAPDATERHLVRYSTTAALDRNGSAISTS